MSNDILIYISLGTGILLVIMIIAYFLMRKAMNKSDIKYARKLKEGQTSTFSIEILYQKLYILYSRTPFLKRYLRKLRRRLEIINIEDEYLTRLQTSKVLTKAILIIIPLTILIILFTKSNFMLLSILLIFEYFMIETIIGGMVDKIDNKLLEQQLDLFTEMRHAYHETNMVEEAIYEVSQNDELEVSRQAEKIYEILISDDPEAELEKYYDIAPNSYLKEFAGVSYLTKEFGDRTVNGASLYLKNLNNITQEMQIEILKRKKLDYVFQSLSVISAIPILFIEPIKNWAVSQFSFTDSFYKAEGGFIVQILLVILTFICYTLIRRVKDNVIDKETTNNNPWQAKVYKNPIGKRIVNMFMPKRGTKEHRKVTKLLKDSASKLKIEWLYVNRVTLAIVVMLLSLVIFQQVHNVAIEYVYTNPTKDFDLIGDMNERDKKKAMELTEQDNYFIKRLKGKPDIQKERILLELKRSEYYEYATDKELEIAVDRLYTKLQIINSQHLKWFEVLFAIVFSIAGYMSPIWLLYFQLKMRQLEMEDEVMQFHTIILMLMKIERVNVEIILEWLERYANIFKEPITKCLNNYESGAWEALEELKEEVSYLQFIRIIESLQAAVEKIPIEKAFDELDTEREYYQDKRKESNERLISKKGMIGKVIGFAPMVALFVGYLIIPLVAIGLMSMASSFASMSSMM